MMVAHAGSPDDRFAAALAVARGGRAAERRRELATARDRYAESLELLGGLDETPLLANVLRWMGSVCRDLGDIDAADRSYRESLAVAQATNAWSGQASALNCQAAIAQRRGDLEGAAMLYREAGRLAVQAGEIRLSGMIEQNLGVLASIQGDLTEALTRYHASLGAFRQVDDEEAVSWVLNNMGMVLNDLRQHEEADRTFTAARNIARRLRNRAMEGILLTNQAEGLIAMERWHDAGLALAQAMDIAQGGEERGREAEALKFLGILERERGRYGRSVAHFADALDIARQVADGLLTGEILRERGDLRLREGDPDGAAADWRSALHELESAGASRDAEGVRARLASIRGGGR
ncbi:MAG: tetratricopeptide repeat protein [Longimicrobiales bacterium]